MISYHELQSKFIAAAYFFLILGSGAGRLVGCMWMKGHMAGWVFNGDTWGGRNKQMVGEPRDIDN